MHICITLVHGTWAKHAPWTDRNSPLCRKLVEKLGESLVLRPFEWSGSNTFSARSRAAANLISFLKEGIQQNPSSRQAIIAHSHGGNVVLYALQDPEIRQRIDDVVCLSTPFIVALPRDLGQSLSVQTKSLAAGFTFILAAVMGLMVIVYWRGMDSHGRLVPLLVVVALLAAAAAVVEDIQAFGRSSEN